MFLGHGGVCQAYEIQYVSGVVPPMLVDISQERSWTIRGIFITM